ncbi:hypothetical protein EDD65_10361 [Keratinibaculum paraultunense]|uniref:Uncharacterized protein n=1 Tax=Keratinibaculum paraultunense TaxID=1278232 RepID=A0A4V2UUG9_9FIRM|nr:hypothetical protein [Keratinibaculum paraultunense]QQY80243.1 hypothetical protein JL105_02590 [Keratinibaculum paraultunense]TCS90756.1 hypothetical protein EDD65_10361 [Keratinibaculum paraultunense]
MEMTTAYGIIGTISIILGVTKEILIIILLVKGIQLANIYLNKNKDGNKVQEKQEESKSLEKDGDKTDS